MPVTGGGWLAGGVKNGVAVLAKRLADWRLLSNMLVSVAGGGGGVSRRGVCRAARLARSLPLWRLTHPRDAAVPAAYLGPWQSRLGSTAISCWRQLGGSISCVAWRRGSQSILVTWRRGDQLTSSQPAYHLGNGARCRQISGIVAGFSGGSRQLQRPSCISAPA